MDTVRPAKSLDQFSAMQCLMSLQNCSAGLRHGHGPIRAGQEARLGESLGFCRNFYNRPSGPPLQAWSGWLCRTGTSLEKTRPSDGGLRPPGAAGWRASCRTLTARAAGTGKLGTAGAEYESVRDSSEADFRLQSDVPCGGGAAASTVQRRNKTRGSRVGRGAESPESRVAPKRRVAPSRESL